MKLVLELQPTRSREKFAKMMQAAKECFEEVFIPDSPLGQPKASPVALSFLASEAGLKPTISLRVIDYAWTGLVNQVYGAALAGVKGILFLRGDKPLRGTVVEDVSPEEALAILKGDEKLAKAVRGGLTISTKYPLEKALERVRLGADFYVVLRRRSDFVEQLRKTCSSELVGYFVVALPANEDLVREKIPREDVVAAEGLREALERWSGLLDTAIVSAPAALSDLLPLLKSQGLC